MSWLSKLLRPSAAPVAPALWTGRVLPQQAFGSLLQSWEIPLDQSYAEINPAALPAFYDWFRAKLDGLGVGRANIRFDCDNFARLYAELLNLRFYLAQWESATVMPDAESAAVAVYCYKPDTGGGHAIVALATPQGLLFIEPQTGATLTLSPAERASHYQTIF